MKCLHNHLLFSLDDGTKFVDESINLLKQMESLGFDEIILTPHYYNDSYYHADNKMKKRIFRILESKCEEENINIKLYLGNEILISTDILEKLENDEMMTLNDSKYILIEFPFNVYYPVFNNILDELIEKGLVPIIAHPERYQYYQINPDKILELTSKGVLFQGNINSIMGYYNSNAKKCFKKFLKMNIYTFLSTDLHQDNNVLVNLSKSKSKIIKIIGEEKYNELTFSNISKVINNKKIKD